MPDEDRTELPDSSAGESLLDAVEGAVSSAAEAEDDAADSEESRESLLEAVQSAIGETEEDAEGESSAPSDDQTETESEPEETEDDKAEAKSDGDDSDEEKDDEKPPPFHDHPRWKKVIRQRNEAREELETLRPDAEQFGRVREYMNTYGIAGEEMAQAFEVMALVKTDPAQARERFLGFVNQIDGILGNTIPEDIQGQIDRGEITQNAGLELSRARATAENERLARQRSEDTREAEKTEIATRTIADSMNEYEATIATSDPDYQTVKKSFVQNAVLTRINALGRPVQSLEEARTIFDEELAKVNETLDRARPKKPAIDPPRVPQGGKSSKANGLAPEAKTLLEHVTNTLDKAGTGSHA